ncbi:MAG: DUF4372 domain-containing protein [Bacilli bacterium]|nr:DUF4372 domain-containing protein [Bacilli bacterium]
MNTKKTIFSQIMSLVSRYEFQKYVDRYKGDWLYSSKVISIPYSM